MGGKTGDAEWREGGHVIDSLLRPSRADTEIKIFWANKS